MEDTISEISENEYHESEYIKFKLQILALRRQKLNLLYQIRQEQDEVRSILLLECWKELKKKALE